MKFKSIIVGLAVAVGMFGTAFAADLPSRTRAPIPVFVESSTTGFFAGVRAGYGFNAHLPVLGANVGYDFGLVRAELNYDRLGIDHGANLFTANAIGQYRLGALTPYVLAGVGYANVSKNLWFLPTYNTAVWNVGGGARYNLTSNIAIDARYRYVQGFKDYNFPLYNSRLREHILTAGVEYRF